MNFNPLAQALAAQGIAAYFVGGCVRDAILGTGSDDIDIVLVGASGKDVGGLLAPFFAKVAAVENASFPIWIATTENGAKVDFALARRESKTGEARTDFHCVTDGVTLRDDLRRRDLTINAIAQDILTGGIADPFGGANDLRAGIARPVSEAFGEDPLRVLRAARFMARFGLTASESLLTTCRALTPDGMPTNRVGEELSKMLHQAAVPSVFFRFLREVGWMGHHFPQVEALVGLPQDPEWHPEGDVFEHTMHCMDAAQRSDIRLVMLCHDLGKATTTVFDRGRHRAPGHAEAGVVPTLEMLSAISYADGREQKRIAQMVAFHMFHTNTEFTARAVGRMQRKLAKAGWTFDDLVEVSRCDVSGRPPLAPHTPDIGQALARELQSVPSARIVTGTMLMEHGYEPGPAMGAKLNELESFQASGELTADNWESFL